LHGIRPVIGKAFDLFYLRQDNGHSKKHSKKDIQLRELRELCESRDPCGLRNRTTEF